ncbi:MAG: response regulator transcription factor [Trueperaceae bacterium]|nr:response regulator transcription factor [Trueperaceae bacterium]
MKPYLTSSEQRLNTKQLNQTVFLVDDHPTVRAGIRTLLEHEAGLHVIGEASCAKEALTKISKLKPDMAILDISLPDWSGTELAKQLRRKVSEVKLIALSIYDDTHHIQDFLAAGGMAYVPKSGLTRDLLAAVTEVSQGRYYLPETALIQLAGMFKDIPVLQDQLTERENSVIRLMAKGLTFKEIGQILELSPKTAATYRRRASEKLGLKSRAQLMRWVFEHPQVKTQSQ